MALIVISGTATPIELDFIATYDKKLRPDVLHIAETSGSPNKVDIKFYDYKVAEDIINLAQYTLTVPANTLTLIPLINVGKYAKIQVSGDGTFDLVIDGILIPLTEEEREIDGLILMNENVDILNKEVLNEW